MERSKVYWQPKLVDGKLPKPLKLRKKDSFDALPLHFERDIEEDGKTVTKQFVLKFRLRRTLESDTRAGIRKVSSAIRALNKERAPDGKEPVIYVQFMAYYISPEVAARTGLELTPGFHARPRTCIVADFDKLPRGFRSWSSFERAARRYATRGDDGNKLPNGERRCFVLRSRSGRLKLIFPVCMSVDTKCVYDRVGSIASQHDQDRFRFLRLALPQAWYEAIDTSGAATYASFFTADMIAQWHLQGPKVRFERLGAYFKRARPQLAAARPLEEGPRLRPTVRPAQPYLGVKPLTSEELKKRDLDKLKKSRTALKVARFLCAMPRLQDKKGAQVSARRIAASMKNMSKDQVERALKSLKKAGYIKVLAGPAHKGMKRNVVVLGEKLLGFARRQRPVNPKVEATKQEAATKAGRERILAGVLAYAEKGNYHNSYFFAANAFASADEMVEWYRRSFPDWSDDPEREVKARDCHEHALRRMAEKGKTPLAS